MVRDTSIKAYHEILDEGLVDGMKLRVMRLIRENPGLCDQEYLALDPGLTINQLTGRRNDLMDLGIVVEAGKKVSPKSGREVMSWMIPDSVVVRDKDESKRRMKPCPVCHGKGKVVATENGDLALFGGRS